MQDTEPVSCAGLHVLVVDDHADTVDFLQQTLTYAGAAVRGASSAREAEPSLDDVDVVITDYSMPGETGLWLLERALARPRRVPVIVLTGYADQHAAELGRAPFARVLRKPMDPWAICREVHEVVREARETRE